MNFFLRFDSNFEIVLIEKPFWYVENKERKHLRRGG